MKTTLSAAVQYLYGAGVISKDKDIADKTGYNKTTVSSYLSGKIKPSADFISAFERSFGITMKEFEGGGNLQPIPITNPIQSLLERIVQIQADGRVNQSLLIELLSKQSGKTLMELQSVVASAKDAELKQLLAELKRASEK